MSGSTVSTLGETEEFENARGRSGGNEADAVALAAGEVPHHEAQFSLGRSQWSTTVTSVGTFLYSTLNPTAS